jgi:hypothetical protein
MSTGAVVDINGGVCSVRGSSSALAPSEKPGYPPINFVYRHLHDALRGELDRITELVHAIEQRLESDDVTKDLHVLRARYHLLVQVNRYHSSVEDEVRCTANPKFFV